MNPRSSKLNRKEFLAMASVFGAIVMTDSGDAAEAGVDKHKLAGARLHSLELHTSAPLPAMKAFYHQTLGLRVLEEKADRLTLGAGESRLTFVPATQENGKPFYHFAFNIPENKVLSARTWQLERTPLMPIPPRLRDPAYPDDVVNYSHWNAHSLFFFDPGGNVVEYIARHDLKNAAPGPFTSRDMLCLSEIGLIVDDVLATAENLKGVLKLNQYRGGSEQFTALGDEHGLLLVMKRGRILDFSETSTAKAAKVYHTAVQIHNAAPTGFRFPDYPYEISVEA